jgi:hypothetical protein
LLSVVDADDDTGATEIDCVGVALAVAAIGDDSAAVDEADGRRFNIVDPILTPATVKTKGSDAVKERSVLLQHVVLRAWLPSKPPVGQHHLLSFKQ